MRRLEELPQPRAGGACAHASTKARSSTFVQDVLVEQPNSVGILFCRRAVTYDLEYTS